MFPGLIFTFQMIYQIILLQKYKFHPKGILMYYDKYVYIYVCVCVNTHIYKKYIYVWIHVYSLIYIYTHIVCMYICVYVYIHTYTFLSPKLLYGIASDQIRSVAQSCLTFCNPMNHSTPGLPVHHQLPEFTQTHVHRVSDAIQPSHPLSSPSPPVPNPSQHHSLFQWVNSSHEVAKVLEFQL